MLGPLKKTKKKTNNSWLTFRCSRAKRCMPDHRCGLLAHLKNRKTPIINVIGFSCVFSWKGGILWTFHFYCLLVMSEWPFISNRKLSGSHCHHQWDRKCGFCIHIFLTEDIFTCHCMKSTDIVNDIDDGHLSVFANIE